MKNICIVFAMIFLFANISAKNYYFSSSSGNDYYTSQQAQHKETPWKTLNKLNGMVMTLNGGDSVLLKRGDIFSGSIIISRSDWYVPSKARIVIGAYGKGSNPEITGARSLGNWIKLNNHLWKAKCNKGDSVNNLLINGKPQQLGRYPNINAKNKGYLTISTHMGKSQITCSDEITNIDWTGAEMVVRSQRWILDKTIIASQKGNTFNFSRPITYEPTNGFGCFIQNCVKTLDENGEWYYDSRSNFVYLYDVNDPNQLNIQVGVLPILIYVSKAGIIGIENITLNGASKAALKINYGFDIQIHNLSILNSGNNAFQAFGSRNIEFVNNYIYNTNNTSIEFNYCSNILIRNNIIKHTALMSGMGLGGDLQSNGMLLIGSNYQVENNKIDSVGYNGIYFMCDSITIKNNFISNFCINKDDGGGLYTYSKIEHIRQKITGNIIVNGHGAPEGTTYMDDFCNGIYLDDNSMNIEISDNTIYRCKYSGIYIRNSKKIKTFHNLIYDNNTQIRFLHDTTAHTQTVINCETFNNILFSELPNQHLIEIWLSGGGETKDVGTFDHNYFYSPAPEGGEIIIDDQLHNNKPEVLTLLQWQQKYLMDQHSRIISSKFPAYKINKFLSPNLILNEALTDLEYWYCWSVCKNAKMENDEGNRLSGTGLRLSFNSVTNIGGARLFVFPNSFPVKKGHQYLLNFSAKSSQPGIPVIVNLRNANNKYVGLDKKAFFRLDKTVKNYQYVFTSASDEDKAGIDFELYENENIVWLGNVELYEADITVTNNLLRLEYNDQNYNKTFQLDNECSDIEGNVFKTEITLQPYSSVILFNSPDSSKVQSNLCEFQIIKEVKIKPWQHSYHFIMLFIVLLSAIVYYFRSWKLFKSSGITFIILLLFTWAYFLHKSKPYRMEGSLKLQNKSLIVNNHTYVLDNIANISFFVSGYEGQHALPYRSSKDKVDGSVNYIRFETKDGQKKEIRFMIDKFTDIDKIKELVYYWNYLGNKVSLNIATEWI